MQNYDPELEQYTFNFNQLSNGSKLIPQNYFCFFQVTLESDDETEWELAIASRNSSSRSIKIDCESSFGKRSLQYRKDFNSSQETQNSTKRLSFATKSLGDYSDRVNISFFNEHSILDQNLYESEFTVWLTRKQRVLTSTDRWIFYGAVGFELVFIAALLYGAYFIRKNYKELKKKEIMIVGSNEVENGKLSQSSQMRYESKRSVIVDHQERQDTKSNDLSELNVGGRNTHAHVRQSKQSSVLDFEP